MAHPVLVVLADLVAHHCLGDLAVPADHRKDLEAVEVTLVVVAVSPLSSVLPSSRSSVVVKSLWENVPAVRPLCPRDG